MMFGNPNQIVIQTTKWIIQNYFDNILLLLLQKHQLRLMFSFKVFEAIRTQMIFVNIVSF